MGEAHIREQGDAASDYGQDLQAEREALSMTLGRTTNMRRSSPPRG